MHWSSTPIEVVFSLKRNVAFLIVTLLLFILLFVHFQPAGYHFSQVYLDLPFFYNPAWPWGPLLLGLIGCMIGMGLSNAFMICASVLVFLFISCAFIIITTIYSFLINLTHLIIKDGAQLIVASGQRVLVYDTADGDLIQSLKGTQIFDLLISPQSHNLLLLLWKCRFTSHSHWNFRTQKHCILCSICKRWKKICFWRVFFYLNYNMDIEY